MRLILLDRVTEKRFHFYPLALSRPIWELRCGMTSLADKLISKIGASDVACFVPPYMADVYRAQVRWPVNDSASLSSFSNSVSLLFISAEFTIASAKFNPKLHILKNAISPTYQEICMIICDKYMSVDPTVSEVRNRILNYPVLSA